jgi:mannose-6-phosphate isomerase
METLFVPLRFKPVYQTYLWGGENLKTRLGRTDAPDGIVAESWEISDLDDGMCVVADGPLAGKTFRELMETHGAAILGPRGKTDRFPLLIKVLDAAKTLSVQVHPNDDTAKEFGGEAKTEMWYVLDAAPGAVVYCGLNDGVTPESFRQAIEDNTLEGLMKTIPVKAGDAIFVPGGRVHAIGAGCLLLEVQQNSNTTYRIYDWGRVDANGRGRELHIDKALEVTLWDDPDSALTPARPLEPFCGLTREKVMESPYFRLESLKVPGETVLAFDGESFQVLFAIEQGFTVTGNGETVDVPEGSSVLIPAALREVTLLPDTADARVMRVFLP